MKRLLLVLYLVACAVLGGVLALLTSIGAAEARVTPPATIALSTPLPVALGERVDFAWTAPGVKSPRLVVLCYQPTDPSGYAMLTERGYLVYGEARGATPDQADYVGRYPLVLGSGMSAWLLNGGPAECEASVFYFGRLRGSETYNVLATAPFEAGG